MKLARTSRTPHGFEGDDVFNVFEPTIRGFEWQLARKYGQGTYVIVAGPSDEEPEDVEIVIEEYADPEHRDLWDGMGLDQAAAMAYAAALEAIKE